MGKPYSIDQLLFAEEYFMNLKLENIPSTISSNKENLFLLRSMTRIFEYCSDELIKRDITIIDDIITRKGLEPFPSFVLKTPQVLYSHPLLSLTSRINDPPEYRKKRHLVCEKHLYIPRQIIKAYNLLYLHQHMNNHIDFSSY